MSLSESFLSETNEIPPRETTSAPRASFNVRSWMTANVEVTARAEEQAVVDDTTAEVPLAADDGAGAGAA